MMFLFVMMGISTSAALYEPDGTTSTQYEFDASECNVLWL
jgi:hypothetical protein